jgi:ATP-dependent protease HslVU (ClpYQ) peptidase subunit
MTCIVGLVESGDVWLGGDGMVSVGDAKTPCHAPKVFPVGTLLMAVSGQPRIAQILAHRFELPERGTDDVFAWLCRDVVTAMWARFEELEALQIDKDDDCKTAKSSILVAYEGRLFWIDGLGGVYETQCAFECCGTGGDVASGYLLGNTTDPPEQRIFGALRAAAELLISVGPPFHVMKLDAAEVPP